MTLVLGPGPPTGSPHTCLLSGYQAEGQLCLGGGGQARVRQLVHLAEHEHACHL